jgi:release factor glutamine methyltransferase
MSGSAPAPTPPGPSSLIETLTTSGIEVVVLRAHAFPGGAADVELLVRPNDWKAVGGRFEGLAWRYHLGARGAWRLLPMAHWGFDGGVNLMVYRRLPAAPFPSRALRPLERALWAGASPGPDGALVPEPGALLVHNAVQASRPGSSYHWRDWQDLRANRERVTDWDRVWTLAREARVTGALRRALNAAQAGAQRPPSDGRLFDGALGSFWRAATALQAHARPRPVGPFLAAIPRLGDATFRCRIGGIEVTTGPGVFVPTPTADHFVELALEWSQGLPSPVVVEVGTGCGAVALAVAAARPDADVHAVDLSRAAIVRARRNRRELGLSNVLIQRGSLLEPVSEGLTGRVGVILANLPYITADRYVPLGGMPRDTIAGEGDDGLGLHRRLARDAVRFLQPGGRLVLQMGAVQWDAFAVELAELGYRPGDPVRLGEFVIAPADRPAE